MFSNKSGALIFALFLSVFSLPALAWDTGPEACAHNECSGGVTRDSVPDTQPKYANSVIPGRVADCPTGYTNMGLTCFRGADSISAPSILASCPSGWTNMGLFCGKWFLQTMGPSGMVCPSGYFKDNVVYRCHQICPTGYTNTGETCFRGADSLSMESMSCPAGEHREGARCYPNPGPCSADREYYAGLCYSKCPAGSYRSAVSTCVHEVMWRGNTHLWIVNRAVELLSRSPQPIAQTVAQRMNEASCRQQWEQGLWDADDKIADTKLRGSHFYNGGGRDYNGNPTNIVTYLIAGVEQNQHGNGRTNAAARILEAGNLSTPEQCYALGTALHYLTDATNPMHSSGFSAVSIPLILHAAVEEYTPMIQTRSPALGNWNGALADNNPDQVFHATSVKFGALAPELLATMKYDGTLCTMTIEPGVTYTGNCFLQQPAVDAKIGQILGESYQATASYLYSVFKAAGR
ncbi:MAG: hypothetical protein HYZ45_02565 [Burkholderiales bacterium]|nr:hypothetical protein [Burkholderiales bacterium]